MLIDIFDLNKKSKKSHDFCQPWSSGHFDIYVAAAQLVMK